MIIIDTKNNNNRYIEDTMYICQICPISNCMCQKYSGKYSRWKGPYCYFHWLPLDISASHILTAMIQGCYFNIFTAKLLHQVVFKMKSNLKWAELPSCQYHPKHQVTMIELLIWLLEIAILFSKKVQHFRCQHCVHWKILNMLWTKAVNSF